MSSFCACLFGSGGNSDVETNHHPESAAVINRNNKNVHNFRGRRVKVAFSETVSYVTQSLRSHSFRKVPTWVDRLRPDLRFKIRIWLISFHHLDPRHQILTFFNIVAKQGVDKMVDEQDENDNCDDNTTQYDMNHDGSSEEFDLISEYSAKCGRRKSSVYNFLSHIFNTTSILTVWRPTTNDAMRRMMMGEGVGKGLNIKGKSAKKGTLSAYVPFMQIHRESDKQLVSKIHRNAKLRVYYPSQELRQIAINALVGKKKDDNEIEEQLLLSFTVEGKEEEERSSSLNFYDGIKLLDDYTEKNKYGLEVQQRMFWKTYVLDQDITRDEDTETGRPSTPGFQEYNLKTLKQACDTKPPSYPFPVVLQLSEDNPMSPQHLIMAYLENEDVRPVVSDFDGFLMGWRREALWFGCNLPSDQEALMMWSLEQIQRILEEPGCETWTIRWLNILKEEAARGNENIPSMPEYGYGDPKSYSIMEKAAQKLTATGAVRHGSECFNYEFPQEADDKFLIISETLYPVPWRYVSMGELQQVLIEKIEEGFVFPLNPKWILCDPGWKRVYDALMESRALYADMSRDVWFPPYSGIRKKIDALHAKYPNGFQRQEPTDADIERMSVNTMGSQDFKAMQDPVLRENIIQMPSLSGKDAQTLAQLELENFLSEREKKMTRNNRDIMNESSSSFNDDDIQGMSRNTMGSQDFKEAMKGPVLRSSSSLVVGDLNINDDNDGKKQQQPTNIQRTSGNTMGSQDLKEAIRDPVLMSSLSSSKDATQLESENFLSERRGKATNGNLDESSSSSLVTKDINNNDDCDDEDGDDDKKISLTNHKL